jgi:hypothetical protein
MCEGFPGLMVLEAFFGLLGWLRGQKDMQTAAVEASKDRRSEERKRPGRYYSAEVFIDALETPYQFKIWNMASVSLAILVKEGSGILPLLKVGQTVNVKYYPEDCSTPTGYQKTIIRHVTKNDHGRLRGHYLVGLEILEGSAGKM